jgi:hypothetical protein
VHCSRFSLDKGRKSSVSGDAEGIISTPTIEFAKKSGNMPKQDADPDRPQFHKIKPTLGQIREKRASFDVRSFGSRPSAGSGPQA